MLWIIIIGEAILIAFIIVRMMILRSHRKEEKEPPSPGERPPDLSLEIPDEENWDQPSA